MCDKRTVQEIVGDAAKKAAEKGEKVKYIISYDFTRGKSYRDKLDKKLNSLGAKRILESQWVVKYSGDSEALYYEIKSYFIKNDRILINPLATTNWSAWNLDGGIDLGNFRDLAITFKAFLLRPFQAQT